MVVTHRFNANVFLIVAIASTCFLSGCMTTPASLTRSYGQPDMTYEAAGDQGRFYLGGDPGEHEWNWYIKKMYYTDHDIVYIFVESTFTNSRPINDEDLEKLNDLRQNHEP